MGLSLSRLVDCENEVCVKVNNTYLEASQEFKDMLEGIAKLYRRNIKYSADEIVNELGIARATLFWRLKKLGITLEQLKEAVIKEYEEKTQKQLKKREEKALPPKDFNEFMEREIVKEIVKKLNTANLSEVQRTKILRYWFRLCKDLGLAPEDFNKENEEELKSKVLDWMNDRIAKGYDKDWIISLIQGIQKWLEVRLLNSGIEQSEYKGKYQTSEIPLEVRNSIVKDLLELYKQTKNKFYLEVIKALAFLYYTGSRSEALTNYAVEFTQKIKDEEIKRIYGIDEFIVVKTEEKGKKGKKITWRKLIPKTYVELLPARMTKKELYKVRDIVRNLLLKYVDKLNEDAKQYVVSAKRSLHLMRHTSAREFLRAFGFNRYLVSKLLGWQKESNLSIYGDYDLLTLLNVRSEEHKVEFVSEDVLNEVLNVVRTARE